MSQFQCHLFAGIGWFYSCIIPRQEKGTQISLCYRGNSSQWGSGGCRNEKKSPFDAKTSVLNETDVSTTKNTQIIEVLDFPKLQVAGNRLKYEFNKNIETDG